MTMDLITAPASFDMAPGFVDPVRESNGVFRAVMNALSHPGDVATIEAELVPPPPLKPAMAAIALGLLDFETRFWLPDDAMDARAWIRFHTGARIAEAPGDADFVLVPRGARLPALDTLALGSDEEPHRSATVLLGVRGFGGGRSLRLSGPGIRETATLLVDGLPEGVLAAREAMTSWFPRGVDIVLTAGRELVALPRTTRVEV